MEKFDENKYKREYNKEHYSTFKVNLKKTEKEDLEKLLKKQRMTKASFLRNAIKKFSINYDINYSYDNEEIINELKRNIEEFGENHKCILVYKVIDNKIFFTNYNFIEEEGFFNLKKELDKDEKYIVTDFKYALKLFEEQNKSD